MKQLQRLLFIMVCTMVSQSIWAYRFTVYNESSKKVHIVNVQFLMADTLAIDADILPGDRLVINAPARLSMHCLESVLYIFNPEESSIVKNLTFDIPLCQNSVIPIEEPPLEDV